MPNKETYINYDNNVGVLVGKRRSRYIPSRSAAIPEWGITVPQQQVDLGQWQHGIRQPQSWTVLPPTYDEGIQV